MDDDQDQSQKQQPSLKNIVDNARSIAFQRGKEDPSWNDLWLGMLQIPQFRAVVNKRGVDTSDLVSDLRYASRFDIRASKILPRRSLREDQKSFIDRAREDFLRDLEDFRIAFMGEDPKMVSARFLDDDNLEDDLHDSEDHDADFSGSVEPLSDEVHQKLNDLIAFIRERIERYSSDNDYAHVKNALLGQLIGKVNQRLAASQSRSLGSLQVIASMLDSETTVLDAQRNPANYLDVMSENASGPMTPNDVVKLVMNMSGPFYKQLLVRNGEYTTDTRYEDKVSGFFPSRRIQELALDAVGNAYEYRSDIVDSRHVALALLQKWTVQSHLRQLGVDDQMKLRDGYCEVAFKAEEEKAGGVRRHPRISREFRHLLDRLNEFVERYEDDEHAAPRALRELMRIDHDIDVAINKAGLRRRMLRSWAKPYADDGQKTGRKEKEKKEGRKKKEQGPQVSDSRMEALIKAFCKDYTAQAGARKFDPMIGREDVMDQIETTLLKRGKKNPIVIGEPGIGKTKILEGFAQRLACGQVPAKLAGARLLLLDLHAMNDSPYISMFEQKLKGLMDAVAERNAAGKGPPIIIAIDEFAGSVDAGGHTHSEGAATLLKPYLTSGDIYLIPLTTRDEYEKKIGKDTALTRRLNVVEMAPPKAAEAEAILAGLKARYSSHHGLRIPNALVRVVIQRAERYVHTVNQPDKSIDMLDHACAIAVARGAKTLHIDHVDEAASAASGIPLEFIRGDQRKRYIELAPTLKSWVLEQDEAIDEIAAAVQRSKAGLGDPDKPMGSFIFLGPTGVGKTQVARSLAEFLYGGDNYLLRYDMGEYQDRHAGARLIGAPPGYVGYEEGGKLIRDVRAKPFSVVLCDEVEKAHPDVMDVLLAPLSNGAVTDGRGRKADTKHTITILTSNVGARKAAETSLGFDRSANADRKAIFMAEAEREFRPEFLGRFDAVVCFNHLSRSAITTLTGRHVDVTSERLRAAHGLDLRLDPALYDLVADRGYSEQYGARFLQRTWERTVASPLAGWLLQQPVRQVQRASSLAVSRRDGTEDQLDFELTAG